jgi:hypothetical protein
MTAQGFFLFFFFIPFPSFYSTGTSAYSFFSQSTLVHRLLFLHRVQLSACTISTGGGAGRPPSSPGVLLSLTFFRYQLCWVRRCWPRHLVHHDSLPHLVVHCIVESPSTALSTYSSRSGLVRFSSSSSAWHAAAQYMKPFAEIE